VGVEGGALEAVADVVGRPPLGVQLHHHPVHEGVPAHGGAEAAKGVGGAELGDDPVVAVPLDDGPVEVEHHHHPASGGGGGGRVAVNASGHLSCSDGDRGKAGRVKMESRSPDERTAAPD
jgi:hypothetical protein